ncbi:MAG: translation initiation factor IF-5A, partial [Methanobacteriota archaeon]
KSTAQVLAINGNTAQVMDKDTYETYDVVIPSELSSDISEGKEVEVMEAMGRKAILRVFKGE